jgi:hypothetical protein
LFVTDAYAESTTYHTDKVNSNASDQCIHSFVSLGFSLTVSKIRVSTFEHESCECEEEESKEHQASAVGTAALSYGVHFIIYTIKTLGFWGPGGV